jgi:MFS family permease
VFLSGILLVLAGGLAGGFAQDLTSLIVARALIGVGTSTGYPPAMLLIRRRAEQAGLDTPPGNVLGGLVIAGMVTPAIGLPIGGALAGAWGWRTTFFVNVPFAPVTLATAARWIPRDPHREQARSVREAVARIDVAGIGPGRRGSCAFLCHTCGGGERDSPMAMTGAQPLKSPGPTTKKDTKTWVREQFADARWL